jgi:cytochrome c553
MVRKLPVIIVALAFLIDCASSNAVLAADGAELFVTLTCFSCHGKQGKGMFRTKDKFRYQLKKKILTQLKKDGVPDNIIAKLNPLSKKKYSRKKKLLKALKKVLGKKDTNRYKDVIARNAEKIVYLKGDLTSGFEAYPKLVGNKHLYLFKQITAILGGERTNGNSDAMRGIKQFVDQKKITDKDLKAIALYLSAIE